jgi:nitrogen fixation/metabolism regulation signal transduction histidine kinase
MRRIGALGSNVYVVNLGSPHYMNDSSPDKEAVAARGANGDERGATDEPRARRRSAPWFLGGLVLLLLSVLLVLQVFGLWEVVTPDTASDTLLLYALSSLNFAAFIVFTFIFVRSLLKLRRERRERQLGSKIKTRLVVYFITVSLLPITAMAVFSYIFFNRSLEKWFSSLPEEVVREAAAAQRNNLLQQEESLLETASTIAQMIDGGSGEAGLTSYQPVVERARLAFLLIQMANGKSEIFAANPAYAERHETVTEAARRAFEENGGSYFFQQEKIFELKTGASAVLLVVVMPLEDSRSLLVARERRTDANLSKLAAGAKTFEDFKRRQRRVRLLGLSTLGLLTLMLLFAATWSAIHLARGIATPIRALAEASDQVASGNLHHRVTAIADDELALLAASFNQMTAQLEENRRRIEAGAAELREKHLALAERRDYIETVLESLSTGVVSLDANDQLTTINAAALSMLRLERAPAAGTKLTDILSAGDYALLEPMLRRARLRGRAGGQMELAPASAHGDQNGDGSEQGSVETGGAIPVALTAIALGSQGVGRRGVVLVMEDLSELLAAQRAAAWSEVARRMAHEIKNPLTPIQLSAERIARHFRRGDSADGNGAERERVVRVVEECTATIRREVSALKAMVDEFSRFARLPHARLDPADLNEVVRQSVALYEERLGDARLDVRLAHSLPGAMLDSEQLRRVFVNLIDNALEALDDTGGERRITIATAHDPARGLLLAEVADNGHGIAQADFPRLFQPYFSTRGRGTGLGLAIVQRIIAEHGGRIRAEANRPRGARFILELPVAEETKTNAEREMRNDELKPIDSSVH